MKVVITPKSDQWNADDFLAGSRTFTVTGAQPRKDEPEKIEVVLAESNSKVWRPPNGMVSVLIQLWGSDSTAWNGRRVTLFTDPSVRFGKETPGGIRISHMSDIGDKPATAKITISRGRKGPYTVKPLTEQAPPVEPWRAQWQAISNALTEAGYAGDSLAMLATAGQVIGQQWDHPNKISAEDAQKILAAVRENEPEENE